MLKMSHPYQCLCYCPRAGQLETGILVGASGCSIHTFSAQNGRYLSTWPPLEKDVQARLRRHRSENDSEVSNLKKSSQDDFERSVKRQKLSLTRDESGSSSAEIVVARDSDNEQLSSQQAPPKPSVVKLACTLNGQHVVAVTGEDKCIRVFDLAADGTLIQLSERQDGTNRFR